MTSRDFCFWLQGYFEIHGNRTVSPETGIYNLNEEQIEMIKRHLSLVFKHEIDPSMGDKTKQEILNALHGSTKKEHLDILKASRLTSDIDDYHRPHSLSPGYHGDVKPNC